MHVSRVPVPRARTRIGARAWMRLSRAAASRVRAVLAVSVSGHGWACPAYPGAPRPHRVGARAQGPVPRTGAAPAPSPPPRSAHGCTACRTAGDGPRRAVPGRRRSGETAEGRVSVFGHPPLAWGHPVTA
ncbi:hypothetical protein TNCT1_31950 [Streptomyces sp. 1-11]|nr:hypothetical protein TNCT1_31950 [Streptomyces sp. 1-11]